MDTSRLNIALAHDSFTQAGGAERVMEALHELFPQAPVFTLVCSREFAAKYAKWDIRTSWLQVFYNFFPKFPLYLPLIPLAVQSLDLNSYDMVISSSSGFIKNLRCPKNCIHVNYCHTPARFLWVDSEYVNQEVPAIFRPVVRQILNLMKRWDYAGAQRVSHFLANSNEVKKRIQEIYKRESKVLYPFVDTQFWRPTLPKGKHFLLAGRLQAHKKNELIIKIFNDLGLPLRVAGTGRQEKYLRSIGRPNIEFLGRVTDEQLRDEYSSAAGFIYPQIEDFGLMPLEAAACGTATLAFGAGGTLETVIPGVTGEFFSSYSKEEINKAICSWQTEKYMLEDLQSQANKFNKQLFKQQVLEFIRPLIP